LPPGSVLAFTPEAGREGHWFFVMKGEVFAEGEELSVGDSLGWFAEETFSIENKGIESAEALLFGVPLLTAP